MNFLRSKNQYDSPEQRVPPIPDDETTHRMPAEEDPHEGTWLQWPHNYGWDSNHVERYERTWVEMTKALCTGERVHIVVYDDGGKELERVKRVVLKNIPTPKDQSQIDFHEWRTDDVWIRDNGPVFVFGSSNSDGGKEEEETIRINNWIFNAWGGKAECYYDNYIPIRVGNALDVPVSDIPMVLEGGAIEVDGRGTLMAKKSCILNSNRNKGWKQSDAESYFRRYLGVSNFVWLDGKKGGDITDDHIDGTARFGPNGKSIITFYEDDFDAKKEYKALKSAVDANGDAYRLIHLPITTKKIKKVGDYGIYINFYVGNEVVLVPAYNDPNDAIAVNTLQGVYNTRRVIGIECTELYKDGGMIHCVTQQQPATTSKTRRNTKM